MKEVVVRLADAKLASRAAESGFSTFITDRPLKGLGRFDVLTVRNGAIHRGDRRVGDWVRLASKADEKRIAGLKGKRELVVVEAKDWRVIPFENLLAALAGKTKLYAVASSPKEAELFLTTLEKGVDGVVVRASSAKELAPYRKVLEGLENRVRKLTTATVTKIEAAGLGERVCVDTANLFEEGEGMLVGSSAQGLFLVAAETLETPYVRARPFRVNAGAIHSYVLSGDKTYYLSELESGQRLEAVGRSGTARPVVAGRLKIETRPLLIVEAETAGRRYRVLLQNAETIRLVPPSGRPKSVAKLELGDKVLLHLASGARHFGMAIEERIEER